MLLSPRRRGASATNRTSCLSNYFSHQQTWRKINSLNVIAFSRGSRKHHFWHANMFSNLFVLIGPTLFSEVSDLENIRTLIIRSPAAQAHSTETSAHSCTHRVPPTPSRQRLQQPPPHSHPNPKISCYSPPKPSRTHPGDRALTFSH